MKPLYNNTSRNDDMEINVDIMYSIIGVKEAPELPLRQELLIQGIEAVYMAKGIGQKVVSKEQKKRERKLLEQLKHIETKLELTKSYRKSAKREKAHALIKELRIQMEHCARTISYEQYVAELKNLKNNTTEDRRDDIEKEQRYTSQDGSFTNHDGSVNKGHIESKLIQALKMLEDTGSDGLLSEDSSDQNTSGSLLSEDDTLNTIDMINNTVRSLNTSHDSLSTLEDAFDDQKKSNDAHSAIASISGYTTKSFQTTGTGVTILASNTAKKTILRRGKSDDSYLSSRSSSVRFKDVKPSVEDSLAKARALIDNARDVKRTFSNDSNGSTIKPSGSYKDVETSSFQLEDLKEDEDRIHLFVNHACNFSHSVLLSRAVKGLQDIVSISFVDCSWQAQQVWDADAALNPDYDVSFWCIEKEANSDDLAYQSLQKEFLSQSERGIKVPLLYDKLSRKVISNNSADIMYIFNFSLNHVAKRPRVNLFPPGIKKDSDRMNQWLQSSLVLSVYQCGLAKSQKQYVDAIEKLTNTLDKAESIVGQRGFLVGEKLTVSDVRLFSILIRFDEIYRVLFHTNTRKISSMPALMSYMKDIYNIDGVKDTCDFLSMKNEYFSARCEGGKGYIVPRGGEFIRMLQQ